MKTFVTKHFTELNEIFIMHCSMGHYPTMSLKEFQGMAKKYEIIDKNCSNFMVALLFKAANVEETDQEANDDVSLCRFEFWELIARIAEMKYIKPEIEEDLGAAFERLMHEHILI